MKLIKGLVGILVHNQLGMSVSGECAQQKQISLLFCHLHWSLCQSHALYSKSVFT